MPAKSIFATRNETGERTGLLECNGKWNATTRARGAACRDKFGPCPKSALVAAFCRRSP